VPREGSQTSKGLITRSVAQQRNNCNGTPKDESPRTVKKTCIDEGQNQAYGGDDFNGPKQI
jgi:hypothetical protein